MVAFSRGLSEGYFTNHSSEGWLKRPFVLRSCISYLFSLILLLVQLKREAGAICLGYPDYFLLQKQSSKVKVCVLVRVLLLWTDTMTKATLIRTTFNWGCLIGSEVQSIIIMVQKELRVLHLHLKAARRILTSTQLGWGVLKPTPTVTHLLQHGHTS